MKVDIFDNYSLNKMVVETDYTLRIFVRSAQNLSAVDNKVNSLRNQLAGDKALSSADPFLKMRIVGEGEDFYDGREKAQEETLSPEFYEL